MKTIKKLLWVGALASLCIFLRLLDSSHAAAPALSIALTSTNQAALTVNNGTNTFSYDIYTTLALATNTLVFTNAGWTLMSTGAIGVTNFTVRTDTNAAAFFRAVVGNDQDGDGIPDQQDARPFDPTIGILTLTVESPTNGATLH